MARTCLAGTAGLVGLLFVILILTAVPNQAQGPPSGLDVTVINPPGAPVPVTGSLGVAGEADVNVVNVPEVEVINLPDVQPVEIVNGPQIAGDRLGFSMTVPGDDTFLLVPDDAILTDLVITVVPNARCLFTIYRGSEVDFANDGLFRLGLGEASDSNLYEMHLQSGLPGFLLFQMTMAGSDGQTCSGQLFWRGFQTANG